MAKYGIPAGQLDHYREGAHGKALYEEANFASPTCIGCHGSHAALPPTVSEIAQVCGHCHQLMARAFYAGPHGDPSLAGSLPGCLACHTTHGTERIPPDQVDELCATCHDVDGRVPGLAGEIEEELLRARQDLAAATHAIEEMETTGRSVADERFRYLAAYTAYKQFGRVQHSLDLAQLEELGRQVRSNTGVIDATAEAYAEERWEHKLLLIPVWFLALSALVLAMFKLRDLEQ